MLPKMSTMSMSMSMSISFQSDMLSAICKGSSTFCSLPRATAPFRLRAFSTAVADKPSVCTADELHYVSLSNSDWKLALWRYNPSPLAPPRNHPLLLLSGVGTNAIGYDLSPESSFARYMSSQGFETWILEVRGAGLSVQGSNSKDIEQSANAMSEKMEAASESATATNGAVASNKELNNIYCAVSEPEISTPNGVETENVAIKERVSGFLSESQSRVMFAKFLDQISKLLVDSPLYEQYNEIEYIMKQSMPKDGKLLAIGHSMGGILLYSMLSRFGFEGKDSNLAAVVTLASSLDYTSSKSTLKLLLPLADPAQALNVPVVPLGAMLAAAYPLSSRPPYVFSWLNTLISAEDMMDPDLLKRLVLNNFCTIPAKLVLQLTTAFRERGLCNRNGTFFYKDHLHKNNIPILAIAGDQDLICPPEAVEETVKLIPEHLVTYKVFGEPEGSHYAHYDLVGGRLAVEQVYPCIIEFLSCHDK
ncbi:uncharacterized protein [Glycine max]|uniref:uncharacterized protein isoform X4 n=1 Tax=Glycine max TaxID=3847 RepID=UPI001B356BF5|nr:uncharacterized protein LOC100776497 isoform X4 [Glycine max]